MAEPPKGMAEELDWLLPIAVRVSHSLRVAQSDDGTVLPYQSMIGVMPLGQQHGRQCGGGVRDVMSEAGIVHIVDDDASLREALAGLFRSVGIESRLYGSTREFVEATPHPSPGCLVLDVRLRARTASSSRRSSPTSASGCPSC
jgi:hypothetical protein